MPLYRIVWEIDIDALNPGQAARLAREVQLDPTSTATVFEVVNSKTGRRWTADSNIGQAGHTLTDLPSAVCTCADRSWYGDGHDSECILRPRMKYWTVIGIWDDTGIVYVDHVKADDPHAAMTLAASLPEPPTQILCALPGKIEGAVCPCEDAGKAAYFEDLWQP